MSERSKVAFISSLELDEKRIDELSYKLEHAITNAADKSLRKNSSKKRMKRNKWYDEDLYRKRRDLIQKSHLLTKNPFNNNIRNSYFKCRREYNKLVKYKKRHFKQIIIKQLENLEDRNPKAYWSLVNKLKDDNNDDVETAIDDDEWVNYFQNLNEVKDKHKETEKRLNRLCEMKEKFTTFSEIMTGINTFKCIKY